LLDWLTEQGSKRGHTLEYSVGFASTGKVRDAIVKLPTKAWGTAVVDAQRALRCEGPQTQVPQINRLSRSRQTRRSHAGGEFQ